MQRGFKFLNLFCFGFFKCKCVSKILALQLAADLRSTFSFVFD